MLMVKFALYLIKYQAMMYGEEGVKLHAFLASTLNGGEWSASRLGTKWIRGWVGFGAVVESSPNN
jgi:hypothetical protein